MPSPTSFVATVEKPTILVIDDDPAVRNSLKFSLEIDGFSVRTYPAAPDLVLSRPLPDRACLVIDHHPLHVDGLDLLKELRSRGVALPAVLIASNPRPMLRERARTAGVPVVEKPLAAGALTAAIETALRGARSLPVGTG